MKKEIEETTKRGRHTQADRPLVEVLKRTIAREEARIERARAEIWKCKLELLDLGVELPLQE